MALWARGQPELPSFLVPSRGLAPKLTLGAPLLTFPSYLLPLESACMCLLVSIGWLLRQKRKLTTLLACRAVDSFRSYWSGVFFAWTMYGIVLVGPLPPFPIQRTYVERTLLLTHRTSLPQVSVDHPHLLPFYHPRLPLTPIRPSLIGITSFHRVFREADTLGGFRPILYG
jgi:hypothetical protein